jgi:hypothetical protein
VWPLTIVQTCIIHYADLPVMPTGVVLPLVAALWVADRSA